MNVKRITILPAVLMFLLAVWTGTAEDAWICGKCGTENTGNFCVSCGQPKVSPTPLPTAEPTPEPTPEPEIWLCRHCHADNAFSVQRGVKIRDQVQRLLPRLRFPPAQSGRGSLQKPTGRIV